MPGFSPHSTTRMGGLSVEGRRTLRSISRFTKPNPAGPAPSTRARCVSPAGISVVPDEAEAHAIGSLAVPLRPPRQAPEPRRTASDPSPPPSPARQQAPGVARDHQLFVGRDHPDATRLLGALIRGPPPVRGRIKLDRRATRHRGTRAHGSPPRSRRSRRKHERIESAQGGREGSQLAPDPVQEDVDREFRAGIGALSRVRMSLELPDIPSRPDWL